MDSTKKEKNENLQANSNNKKETTEFHGEKYKKKSEYPNFLLKLYQILENKDYKDIIEWSEDGKYFIVKNLHDFTENILPKYYKHNNYSSFIRQLNMYDFHKKKGNPNEHIFEHTYFIKDRKDLLKLVKRKSKKETNLNYNNINNINNEGNNKMFYQYPNYFMNNNTNKFYPVQKKELLPYYPNQPFINNNMNGTKPIKNDRKSSFSIDDNLGFNHNSENNSFIQYKKIPLLPMGSPPPIINNNNTNNINNINNTLNKNNIQNQNINEKEEKKITKRNLQNLLSYLIHSVDENTETQKLLEQKIETLTNQNEEFISQNKKILQEIVKKNEYNQRLEAVICFVLEMIMSKSKMKNNQELKNLFISNEPNIPKGNIFNNNSGSILEPYQTFLNKYYERTKNGDINKFNNNNILLEDDNKYYYPINNYEQNINKINTENLKQNLIGNGTEDNLRANNNFPIILNNKRKRSSSFNSILSNFSRGSNVYFNNNKLLKGEEVEKKTEQEKDKKIENEDDNIIKRKNSMSSWSDNNKDVFDLELNQDDNKSFINGDKDLLNNSQTSFNEFYGNSNANNTFSDINN